MPDDAETRQDIEGKTQAGKARFFLEEIDRAGKREKDWRKEGCNIIKRYRNEKKRARSLNILWANTELLKPAVLSRTPQPDVRQRFMVANLIERQAAQILEKGLKFCADDPDYGFVQNLEAARDDMLLPGRGVARVVYEREIGRNTLELNAGGVYPQEPDGYEEDEEGNRTPYRESIDRQLVYCKHIYWEDYREGDARCWEDVPWIAYRHTMTRKELVKQFGAEKGERVPLPLVPKDLSGSDVKQEKEVQHPLSRAVVWEVWDKDGGRKVWWVAEGFKDDVLDQEDDPLGLEGFYPQPDPLLSVKTTDTREPVPEFRVYKDQADELDDISLRIKRLIDALKVRGVYAAICKEMGDLLNGEENELIPVEDWATIQQRGGLEGSIAWLPIDQIAKVLVALYKQRDALKAEIYELTGISDLLRGATNAQETATAQRIKGNFGQLRLNPRQQPMERFARDVFRIKAEIMAEHFTPEQLQMIAGEPVSIEVVSLLRSDKLRAFAVDIETDSTVQPDEQGEKENVVEFMTASTKFLSEAIQVATATPQLAPMLFEMYKAGARRFKMGRELEDKIEETAQQLEQAAQQPQEPQPDPEAQAAQVKAQADSQKAQMGVQEKTMDLMLKREEHRMEMERLQAERIKDMVSEGGEANGGGGAGFDIAQMIAAMFAAQQQQTEAIVQALNSPKQVVRGPDGRAQAVVTAQVQ